MPKFTHQFIGGIEPLQLLMFSFKISIREAAHQKTNLCYIEYCYLSLLILMPYVTPNGYTYID